MAQPWEIYWLNTQTGEVVSTRKKLKPPWKYIMNYNRHKEFEFFVFPKKAGGYDFVTVWRTERLFDFFLNLQQQMFHEDAEKFIQYNKLVYPLIRSFKLRYQAFTDPQLLASLILKKLKKTSDKHTIKKLIKNVVEIEKLLGIQILDQVLPQLPHIPAVFF